MGERVVSVIMAVYNEPEKYLRESIESILNQTLKGFELIIVLDKPDNKKAERIILEYQKKDKRIVFIKNKKNLGLAGSLNKGIYLAKGKYIARMDADDISLPRRLELQVKYIEKNKVDLLFGGAYFIDEKGKIIDKFKPKNEKIKDLKKSFFKRSFFVHPTLLAKRELLKRYRYDERNKRAEDFDLWLRLIAKGYKFGIIEEVLIKYRIVKNNYEKRIAKQKDSLRYSLKALWKNKKYYLTNIYFWRKFSLNMIKLFTIEFVPKGITKKMIYFKDKLREKYGN